jgi:tetratricopeptide (TPR) repeat protein
LILASALTIAGTPSPAPAQSAADVRACGNQNNVDRLITGCTRIIALGSRVAARAQAYSNRGLGHYLKGELDQAMRDADEANRLDPKNAAPYSIRGLVYSARKDYDRAIREYDDAVRLSPKNAIHYSSRGNIYLQKGEYDRAIREFGQALRLAPRDAQSYSDRGVAYAEKGEHDRAIRDFDEAIRYNPKSAGSFNNRGASYRDKGDLDRAIRDNEEAVRLEPKNAKLITGRGATYRARGDLDRALADFNEAIRLEPKLAAAYRFRGLVFQSKGDVERARADLRHTLEIDPSFTKARDDLGRLDSVAAVPAPSAPTVAPVPKSVTAAVPVSPQAPAIPERRVALVIGNGAYANVPALTNPLNDARTVAEALRRVGFTSVRSATNLKRDALVNALKVFAAEAETADWAMVYFAGHGIEVGGVNWLIPVDAALKADRDVQFEAVALEQVLGSVETVKKLALVVLDACRDNPFAAKMRSTTASRSIGRGLAAIEPRRGTLVAFAAKHGQVALDGTGANSPFVSALVRHMQTPGLEINKVFRLVRDDVLNATNSRQEPFIYGTLPAQDFFFASR